MTLDQLAKFVIQQITQAVLKLLLFAQGISFESFLSCVALFTKRPVEDRLRGANVWAVLWHVSHNLVLVGYSMLFGSSWNFGPHRI